MLNNHKWLLVFTVVFSCLVSGCSEKASPIQKQIEVLMFHVNPEGVGNSVGKVIIHPVAGEDQPGIHLQPALHDLPTGEHGFICTKIHLVNRGKRMGKNMRHWPPVAIMILNTPSIMKGQ